MEYLKVERIVPLGESNPFLLSWLKSGKKINVLFLKEKSCPVVLYLGKEEWDFLAKAGWKSSTSIDFKKKGKKIFVKGDSRRLKFSKENLADAVCRILNEEEKGYVELEISHHYFAGRLNDERHSTKQDISRKSSERTGWKVIVKFDNFDAGNYLSHIFSSPGLSTSKGKIGFSYPVIAWWEVSQFIPSQLSSNDKEGIKVGETDNRGELYLDTRKNFHALISGSTGSGKSTLIVGMMKDILESKRGKVILIDPHGDTARKMEGCSTKEFVISPESENTINILRASLEEKINYRVAEDFVSILKSSREVQYAESFVGPRMEDLISRGISILTKVKGATLVDFYNILRGEASRKKICNISSDPEIKVFVDELGSMSKEEKIGTERAIGRLANDPFIRTMICNPSDDGILVKAVRENDLIIVNLERGKMGYDDSRLLSNILAVHIWFIISSLRGTNYYMFLEESQDYQSSLISDMISSGRKFGLRTFFITTSFRDISDKLGPLLLSNITTYIFLRMTEPDKLKVNELLGKHLSFPSEPMEFLIVTSTGEENGHLNPIKFNISGTEFKKREYNFITENTGEELSQKMDELFEILQSCKSILFVLEEFSHYFSDFERREVIALVKDKISTLKNVFYLGRVTLAKDNSRKRYECYELVGSGTNCSSIPKLFMDTSNLLSIHLERK